MISPGSSQEEPSLVPMGADVAAPFIPTFANGAALSSDNNLLSADACCPSTAGTSGAPASPLPTPLFPSPLVGEGAERSEADEGCSSLALRPTPLIRRCAPPSPTRGEGEVAPAVLSIALPASVALILKLVADAKSISPDEAIARAICIYADHIGIPTLARTFDVLTPQAPDGAGYTPDVRSDLRPEADRDAGDDDFRRGG